MPEAGSARHVLQAVAALLFVFISLSGIQAQEASGYQRFDIFILPEYDHPGVGVIVSGEVLPGQYPRYLELQVPEGTSMALLRQPGQDEPVNIGIQQRDGKTYLPVDVTESEFQLQFYFNPFDGDGADRKFRYAILTNEVLPEFHVELYKPIAAINFQHTLVGAEENQDELGLTFFRQHIHDPVPGSVIEVSVSYENPTNTLTVSALQSQLEQMRSQDAGSETQGAMQPGNLGKVLIVLSLVGVGLFAILGWFGGKKSAPAVPVPLVSGPRGVETLATPAPDGGVKFCSSCGAPRRPESRYCSNCGKEF